jgi:hypothetical protein
MCVTSSRLKTPKAAAWVAGEPALCRGTNSFTSAAWRRSNRHAAWKGVADFVSSLSVFPSKTSAVESSSHAPSRASGRPSRGAAHFLAARNAGRTKEKAYTIKTRPGFLTRVESHALLCHVERSRDISKFLSPKIVRDRKPGLANCVGYVQPRLRSTSQQFV